MEELLFYSALTSLLQSIGCLGRLRRQSCRVPLWVSAAPQSEVAWEHRTPNFLRVLLRDATADGDTSRASTAIWNQISSGLLYVVNTICRHHHLLWTLACWDSDQLTLNGGGHSWCPTPGIYLFVPSIPFHYHKQLGIYQIWTFEKKKIMLTHFRECSKAGWQAYLITWVKTKLTLGEMMSHWWHVQGLEADIN